MKRGSLFILAICLLGFSAQLFAQTPPLTPEQITSAYRSYFDLGIQKIKVPTVIEVPFTNVDMERTDVAVWNPATNAFEPSSFKQETSRLLSVTSDRAPADSPLENIIDGNEDTSAEFLLPENDWGKVRLTLSGTEPITADSLTLLLDDHVALPRWAEVRATVGGRERILLADSRMPCCSLLFPRTTAKIWTITFTYGQPLRITELRLNQENTSASSRSLRFLAQPNQTYRIYFNPDRKVSAKVGEAGNLASAKDVLTVTAPTAVPNPAYQIADSDTDGIPDTQDNCVSIANTDQQDLNDNGRGDLCDDFDQDGLLNEKDNCPNLPNRYQEDKDEDGIGDVCDSEESRVTERLPWLPWVGMGGAAAVVVVLFALTVRSGKNRPPAA